MVWLTRAPSEKLGSLKKLDFTKEDSFSYTQKYRLVHEQSGMPLAIIERR